MVNLWQGSGIVQDWTMDWWNGMEQWNGLINHQHGIGGVLIAFLIYNGQYSLSYNFWKQ